MKLVDRGVRQGTGIAGRALMIGAAVMVVFMLGFWGMLMLAGGGPERTAGDPGDAAAPGEQQATTPDPVVPDTTDDTGASAVEGNPGQDEQR